MLPNSNMNRVSPEGKPFFGARLNGDRVEIAGDATVRCGARLPGMRAAADDGIFAEWHWDGRRLVVGNDRYGIYPLFYCARPDSIWVSPSLEQVVRGNSSRELDDAALAVFHRMGHFVGADTPFRDVRFLPPDSTLTWEDGRLQIESRPFAPDPACQGLDFESAVEAYRERFAAAVARRLPVGDRFTVPISGGRDSRHILLELARLGAVPRRCATVKYRPPATNEDTRIARLLSDRLGIEHVELDRPSSFFEASLRDVALTNHCGGGHGWVLPLASHVAGEFDVLYDGLAGSVLSGGFMLAEDKLRLFREGRFEPLARQILSENRNEQALRQVLAATSYAAWSLEAAMERLVPELRAHAQRPNPVLSFVFWNRTRRCVASIPYAILHQVPVVHTPYLDHALFDLLFSLDPAHVEENRLHDEVIRRAYPSFADVPYENKKARGVMQPGDQTYYRDARSELWRHLGAVDPNHAATIDRRYLYARLAADWLQRRDDSPWYLRTALQASELERLRLAA